MALLHVRLLGGFQVELDGSAITEFSTDKVRALLAFLAVESDRAHRRQALAGLLWPDYPEQSARTSLRTGLANLRQAIGDRQADPPFLVITRQAIALNRDSDIWVDVTALDHLVGSSRSLQPSMAQLEQAASLCHGEFLDGFSLADSAPFDDWISVKRAQIRTQMMEVLDRLTAECERTGTYQKAIHYARRQVELDPWRESAQRAMMRLLAETGLRTEALVQYEVCQRLLAADLGIAPEPATTRLYQEIRGGKLGDSAAHPAWSLQGAPSLPHFLTEAAEVKIEDPVFVGREREMRRLRSHFQTALAGREQVIFVVGGAGRGKTALLEETVRQVVTEYPVAVTTGYCNAYSGGGDPYLPFRQVLEMLTGDVDDLWAAGRITRQHATQLWNVSPVAAQAIAETGPDLIDTFLAGAALLERAAAATNGADWVSRLGRLVRAKATSQKPADLEQHDLHDQYARVLERVAQHVPLVIILEDLHWADRGSVELLLHIGRRLANSRILLMGAYRPDEIAADGDGGAHPLGAAIVELESLYGDIVLDLAIEDPAANRQFVNELLDVEPNRLEKAFRRQLYDLTRGHPLFTVETLRMFREQGDLLQDEEGHWVEHRALDWDHVPARVEAVIKKRVDRLDPLPYECLTIASVEGEDLTAEVVARVLNIPERQVLRTLSQVLGRRHRLLRERDESKIGSQSFSRFRFSHHLFQRHVYNSLSAGERRRLHEAIARALEDLFAQEIEAVTIPLAYHYSHTEVKEKALHYLMEAGHHARRRYDGQQAADYYTKALDLAAEDSSDRFGILSARAVVYDLMAQREAQKADLDAMGAMAIRLGDRGLYCDALLALGDFYLATEVFGAREPAQEARCLAQDIGDSVREARALRILSWECRLGADLKTTRTYLEEAAAQFRQAGLPGEAASCLFMLARRLPGSGKQVFELDLAERAMSLSRESDDYNLQAIARKYLAIAYTNLGRDSEALPLAKESLATHRELGDRNAECSTMDVLGVTLTRLGRREEGAATHHRCLALSEEIGSDWGVVGSLFGLWTYQYVPEGEYEEFLGFIDRRLASAIANGHDWLIGFLGFMKTQCLMSLGQYDEALSATVTSAIPVIAEDDLVSQVCVFADAGSLRAALGCYEDARQDLEHALELAEKTSDLYLQGRPLVRLANLALHENRQEQLHKGLEQAQTALEAAQEVREERQWAEALDVRARTHLALDQPEEAFDVSLQALHLLKTHPWLPMPQAHRHTHFLALRALDRKAEAVGYLQRAYERVMFVADKLTDESLRQGWLENVRVNRDILRDWKVLYS